MTDARPLLRDLFFRAVGRVRDPARLLTTLPEPPRGRTLLLAAGKAAGEMARTVEENWDGPLTGLAVTPSACEVPLKRLETTSAGHPFPDKRSVRAASRCLALARDLTADDLALVLLSGGGSALLSLPAPGLTLADKQAITKALFATGADIHAINTVRKHLSAIKGGRLARAAAPARVITRAVSDVAGDEPGVIASGPTVGDPTTAAEALAVLRAHGVQIPERVSAWLASPQAETPKPEDPDMEAAGFRIVASARDAVETAAALAARRGFTVHNLGEAVCGEARDAARDHAKRALTLAASCQTGERHVLLSGGEVTVTLGDCSGEGGPNREFALALALTLQDHPAIAALAADTDGIDGRGEAAGAFVLPGTLARAQALGLNATAMLDAHRSGAFFDRLGMSFITGPTRTNVNDLRMIVIDGSAAA